MTNHPFAFLLIFNNVIYSSYAQTDSEDAAVIIGLSSLGLAACVCIICAAFALRLRHNDDNRIRTNSQQQMIEQTENKQQKQAYDMTIAENKPPYDNESTNATKIIQKEHVELQHSGNNIPISHKSAVSNSEQLYSFPAAVSMEPNANINSMNSSFDQMQELKNDIDAEWEYAKVQSWLTTVVHLPQYFQTFIINGYDTMNKIYKIGEDDTENILTLLDALGIELIGHKRKIINDIKRGRMDPLTHEQEIHASIIKKQKIVRNLSDECNTQRADKCESCLRLLSFMKVFEHWNNEKDIYGAAKWDAFSQSFNKYQITDLLNDQHHFKEKHNDQMNKSFVKSQIKVFCTQTHKIANHEQIVEEQRKFRKELILQDDLLKMQIFDRLHFEFAHNQITKGYEEETKDDHMNDDDSMDEDMPMDYSESDELLDHEPPSYSYQTLSSVHGDTLFDERKEPNLYNPNKNENGSKYTLNTPQSNTVYGNSHSTVYGQSSNMNPHTTKQQMAPTTSGHNTSYKQQQTATTASFGVTLHPTQHQQTTKQIKSTQGQYTKRKQPPSTMGNFKKLPPNPTMHMNEEKKQQQIKPKYARNVPIKHRRSKIVNQLLESKSMPTILTEKLARHKRECSKYFTQIVQIPSSLRLLANNIDNRESKLEIGPDIDMSADAIFESSDDEESDDENSEEPMKSYGFGKIWYYWKKYEHHKDYIRKKYVDLKEELLNNTIKQIDEKYDWDAVYNKACAYIKCIKARSLAASGELVHFYLGDAAKFTGVPIKIYHIMALLFYCNYDTLQSFFSETFRKKSSDESWKSVKLRNAQFANWTRLLREAVELYGVSMNKYPGIKLYHGISCELIFDSIIVRFTPPTSMTTSMSIAESFSKGSGLIITLKEYDKNLRFFDCHWLSNYPTEEEKLFIGGYQLIKLNCIIVSRLGHNYKHYVVAAGIIQNMFDARHNPERRINQKTKNAVKNLLNYKLGKLKKNKRIPEYILILFEYICKKWDKTIKIDLAKFTNNEYGIFKDLIIESQSDLILDDLDAEENAASIKMDVICKIFENTNCIEIVNGFVFTQYTLGSLCDLLAKCANLNMIKLETCPLKQNNKRIRQMIDLFKQRFAEKGWNIQYSQTIEQNVSEYVELIRTYDKSTKM